MGSNENHSRKPELLHSFRYVDIFSFSCYNPVTMILQQAQSIRNGVKLTYETF